MKSNKILILLLFAVVGSTVSVHGEDASPSQSSSSSSSSSSAESDMTDSAESTAESNTDTISMQMDLGLEQDSPSSGSSSEQYQNNQEQSVPAQSKISQQYSVPEFGLRKSNFDSQEVAYSGPNSQSSVVHYEPISASYQNQQQSASAPAAVSTSYREFYNVGDDRRPLFESNPPSDQFQQFGQQQQSNSNNDNGNNNNNNNNGAGNEQQGSATESSDDGGFRPIAMSVDEAFRKYFPESKLNDQLGSQSSSNSGNDQQQQQQQSDHQMQSSQQPSLQSYFQSSPIQSQSQTQQAQQQSQQPQFYQSHQPTDKELFSIDSLREIVEKQPLAKPNPFDPPSPPLSAFLPPPPNSRPESQASAESSYTSTQYGAPSSGQPSSSYSMPQSSISTQSSFNPQSSFPQSFLPQQDTSFVQPPAYAQPQVQTKFVYEKQPEQAGSASGSVVDDVSPDDEEDEGLPYKTDSGDGEKKVSYIYSRPVQLPDVTRTKVVDSYDNANYGKDSQFSGDGGEHIYRKPVSYENDDDNSDHGDDGKNSGSNGYDELEQAYNPNKQIESSQNNGGYPQISSPPSKISLYPNDENDEYGGGKPTPPQVPQSQWINVNSGSGSADYSDSGNKNSDRPSNIEYGGFVPIKHEGQEYTSSVYPDTVSQKSPYDIRSYPQQNFNHFHQQSRPQYQNVPSYHSPSHQDPQGSDEKGYDRDNTFKFPLHQQQQPNFRPKYQNLRFKPIYGKDASKKLQELGINENEFYGTVNNILQKAPYIGKPNFYQKPHSANNVPYMPKANMYKPPPKSYRGQKPYQGGKNRPISNTIAEEFDLKYLKDDLPPGASYNPRDVGLDESVLAQIHLLDSGIGGYRFPTIYPSSPGSMGKMVPSMAPPRPGHYKKQLPKGPFGKGHSAGVSSGQGNVPYATNSIAMPFILQGPKSFLPRRVPYSSTGKGFRSQYGYRAAASEVKPQFSLPNSKAFKFLGQPLSSSNIAPLLASALSSDDASGNAFANMFGIKSIKGIKSLVSYLTSGVKS